MHGVKMQRSEKDAAGAFDGMAIKANFLLCCFV